MGECEANKRSYNVYFYRMNISTHEIGLITVFENISFENGEWVDFSDI